MASFTLTDSNRYPAGQSVSVYPVSNWSSGVVDQNAAPVGSATNTQSMGASNLTFTGLSEGVQYVAYALVNSQHRYTFLRIPAASDAPVAAQPLGQVGTLANRPAAVPGNANVNYFATDDNGGTVYRSDGSTWTKLSPGATQLGGGQIDFASTTTQKTSSSTVTGNDTWAGLSVVDSVGGRPIIVEAACCAAWSDTSGDGACFHIYEGATKLATATMVAGASLIGAGPMYCRANLSGASLPSVGSHTYIVKVNALTGGTATFNANTTANASASPAWISIRGS